MVGVELNFAEVNAGKDWSVVAWGDKGPVYVYHDKDLQTQYMPLAPGVPKPKKPVREESTPPDFF